MKKYTCVTAMGIVSPIFREGDDLVNGVCQSIVDASENEGFSIEDKDIIAVTESVVARTQGNYATVEDIANDIRSKFGGNDLGLVFPIMSRNRFLNLLKGIAIGTTDLYIQLSYPTDEVGNRLVSQKQLLDKKINPYSDSFDEKSFREIFGEDIVHQFTGVDYIELYKNVAPHVKIVFSNDPAHILNYTKNVLCCDVHSRFQTKEIVEQNGTEKVYTLSDILSSSVDGSGYNPEYGLLGSNMATEKNVKLFPRNCQTFVDEVQSVMKTRTGKDIHVMVYGDGGFKDPVGGIWELADPVISPAYTAGLAGTPTEVKMKYLADNDLRDEDPEKVPELLRKMIRDKETCDEAAKLGTTPRRYADLLGSLSDLISGSGDKGTPIVYIKGYFDNYAS